MLIILKLTTSFHLINQQLSVLIYILSSIYFYEVKYIFVLIAPNIMELLIFTFDLFSFIINV
jgi:hypothetical protein